MKTKWWFVLGTLLSTNLLAQQVTSSAPPPALGSPGPSALAAEDPAVQGGTLDAAVPAPKTNAPAAKAAPKKTTRKKASAPKTAARKPARSILRTVPLVPGPATVIASSVNVRGQAGLKGEVVAQVTKGQPVIVFEEIVLKQSAPDEPSAWAKIQLPEGAHVWVNNLFIDNNSKTVVPKRLNLRGGPGENYSILGRIDHGQTVVEVITKGDWTEIEAPTNAYGFVAAQYLKQEPASAAVASLTTSNAPDTTPATPTEVAEAETAAPPPTSESSSSPPVAATAAPETAAAAATPPAAEEETEEEAPPRRIVMREGVVRGTSSIQAPTHFELISPDSGRTIDYLFTDSPDLDLRRYKGLRIVVTGEEGLDARWRNVPVLTIEKIEVLE